MLLPSGKEAPVLIAKHTTGMSLLFHIEEIHLHWWRACSQPGSWAASPKKPKQDRNSGCGISAVMTVATKYVCVYKYVCVNAYVDCTHA